MNKTYTNRKVTIGRETKKVTQENKKIAITVGVFFDGTLNNRFNYKLYKWTTNKKENWEVRR